MAAFAAAALAAFGTGTGHHPARAQSTTRPATAAERDFCQANFALMGPAGNDCSRVPLSGTIEEDDAWGRWDCRTMGDHICGGTIWFNLGGELEGFELNAPDRPACFVEPSMVEGGAERIFYWDMGTRTETLGFEVTCPMR